MPRPKTKEELVQASQSEYDALMRLVEPLPAETTEISGVCGEWNIKDVLAHLHAWHAMFLVWYERGMAGEKPEMPAPGYTWKTTPDLNARIYQEHKNTPLAETLVRLSSSHAGVQKIIIKHSDAELFTKKRYGWTGSTSLGAYLVSTTSSHYDWAQKLIRKFVKTLPLHSEKFGQ